MDRYPVQAQEEHCSRTSWLSPPSRLSKGNFHSVSGCLLAKCAKMDTISKAGVAQSAEQRFCKPQVGGSIPLASSMLPADIPTSSVSFTQLPCSFNSAGVTVSVTIFAFSRSKYVVKDCA